VVAVILPLMFQDAMVMPFFFPAFDWCCFLPTSWSAICKPSVSEVSEGVVQLSIMVSCISRISSMPDFSILEGVTSFLNSAGLPISRGGYSVFEGSTLITPCMYP